MRILLLCVIIHRNLNSGPENIQCPTAQVYFLNYNSRVNKYLKISAIVSYLHNIIIFMFIVQKSS